MATLNHDTHPALVWMWKWAQFSEEDRNSFVALVGRYEDMKHVDKRAALSLLENIITATGAMPNLMVSWHRQESAALGFPLNWTPL